MRIIPRAVALSFVAIHSAIAALDTQKIEEITGSKGKQTGDVFKISAPRTDVKVMVDSMPLDPFLGLTSWAAFTEMKPSDTMVMGDIVLFEDEVNSAMSAALNAGLTVTALHNHFFFDHPRVFFMHIGGDDDPEKLAKGVRAVFDSVKQVRSGRREPADTFGGQRLPDHSAINAAEIEAILGKGEAKDGMLKFVWGRESKMHDTTVGKDMGVNTWAAFFGTNDNAGVDGDFAMDEYELQPVLKAMRSAGVNIVAIHQHMTNEEPRIMFLHYWGRGKATDLANALKTALALTKAAAPRGR